MPRYKDKYAGLPLLNSLGSGDVVEVLDTSDKTESTKGSIKYFLARNLGVQKSTSVINFGADPLGIVDSTAAFQQAQATGSPYVPLGKYRIDGTVDNNEECTWTFERGHQPQRNWFIAPGSWPFDDTVGRECLLFKDESSSNVPFFKIKVRDVNLLGFPRFDVSERDTFTAGIVEYPMGENNPVANNGRTDIWGGVVEIIVTGNDGTLSQAGNGAKCIHVTWTDADSVPFGVMYKCEWYVYGLNVGYGVYIENENDGAPLMSTDCNNLYGRIELIRAKQAVFNDSAPGCLWEGSLQNFSCMDITEAPKAAIYLGPLGRVNIIDFEVYDMSTSPYGSGGDVGVSALVENHAFGTNVVRRQAGSIADTRVTGYMPTGRHEVLHAPIGIVPLTSSGTGQNGLYMSGFDNPLANLPTRCVNEGGSFTYDFYDGTVVADSDTAVSDAVFANASGKSVDITSALGELPTLAVWDIFELTDHSDRENNGAYRVTAVIANGYTCTKTTVNQADQVTIDDDYYVEDPSNAVAEAVTVTTGIGSILNDSVTEAIATSAEWTETRPFSEINKTHGDVPTMSVTADAVTDMDYLELHFDGYQTECSRIYCSIASNGGFERIQCIRKLSGTIVSHVLVDGMPTADQEPAALDRLFASGTADETIMRFIGPRVAGTYTFEDIFATGSTGRSADGHYVSQLGGQNVLGDLNMQGNTTYEGTGPVLDTATTAQLEDITHAVNTRASKVERQLIVNSTTGAVVRSAGNADGSLWLNMDGTTAHTPV